MSDTRFTASNGWYIEEDGRLFDDCDNLQCREGPIETSYTEYGAHKAQAERDAALGRWRSVEHPDWVVYLRSTGWWLLVHEVDGYMIRRMPARAILLVGVPGQVAREYFAAHPVPEPKPWEQATPHEVWVLTFLSGFECAATYVNGKFRYGTGSAMVMENVTAGKCIWKPGASE